MFGEVEGGGGHNSGGFWGGLQPIAPPQSHTQVQGLVRVPLGGGLPTFLQQGFIGDARKQLLGALPGLGDPPDGDHSPPPDPMGGGRKKREQLQVD